MNRAIGCYRATSRDVSRREGSVLDSRGPSRLTTNIARGPALPMRQIQFGLKYTF
jgi:hypothetical protein